MERKQVVDSAMALWLDSFGEQDRLRSVQSGKVEPGRRRLQLTDAGDALGGFAHPPRRSELLGDVRAPVVLGHSAIPSLATSSANRLSHATSSAKSSAASTTIDTGTVR